MIGFLLAMGVGVLIAWINYTVSKWTLLHREAYYIPAQVARHILQLTYLVVLFFLGDRTPWDRSMLLVGGCLGITVPMLWFTYRLVKLNRKMYEENKEDYHG